MLRLLSSLLVAVAASVLAALALVLPSHRGLDPQLAGWALGIGAVAGVGAFIHTPGKRIFRGRRVSPWVWITFVLFGLFALRAFCWLEFNADGMIKISSPNNLGDLSLHTMLARYFANGVAWWPDHPQASGQSMRYYPGMDLFQSLLLLRGAGEFEALVWVGLLGSAATALALYLWGGGFAMAGFLFSGGMAGYRIFITGMFVDYQAEMAWKSLPLAIFITQRGFLFALPAGLLLLAHWRRRFFPPPRSTPGWPAENAEPAGGGLLPFWVEALLYAMLPVFHLFAFFFLSLLLGWWFIVYFQRADLRRHLLLLVGVALVPATFQCWLMTNGFSGGSSVWIEVGWMQKDQPFVAFWLANFGLFAPMAVALWAIRAWWLFAPMAFVLKAFTFQTTVASRSSKTVVSPDIAVDEDNVDAFILPAGLIFLFACVVMLAPWDWDNTKLMIWPYLVALPFLWERWVAPFHSPARWLLCAALFLSGFVSVVGGIGPTHQQGYQLARRSEVDAVRSVVRALPIEARFASSPDYNHPLVFCGRKLVMGYEGHLHSQGLDYSQINADLRLLMLGQPGWQQAAKRLGARYLFWSRWEKIRYAGSSRPWAQACQQVASGEWGELYDLTVPAGNFGQTQEMPPEK